MLLYLREPPVRFLWCCCSSFHFWSSFCCCSSFVDVLHPHLLFIIIPHPSVDYRRVFTPILYFQPSPSQSDSRQFHFQLFRYLLAASATALSGHFLLTGVFYLMLLHQHFNLRLSRFPWEPAVLPWSLQGFILILETQTWSICLFDSQLSTNFIFKLRYISMNCLWWKFNLSAPYSFRTLFACSKSYVKTIEKHFEQE